jgi:hypothetical protein
LSAAHTRNGIKEGATFDWDVSLMKGSPFMVHGAQRWRQNASNLVLCET